MPPRTGRRSKLSPEVHGKIVASIRLGAFDWVAARSAGVSARTFHEWVARGEGRHASRKENEAFAHFAHDVRQARAEARVAAEQAVFRSRPLDWLRMGPGRDRGPEEPGWTDRTEVAGKEGGPVEHVVRIVRE